MNDEQTLLLTTLRKQPQGATTDTLLNELPGWIASDVVNNMNALSAQQYVDFSILPSGELKFTARSAEEKEKTSGMELNERIIYNLVKDSGNKGIWIKDLKNASQIHSQIVTTIVKNLEKRNIIKAVKAVKNSTRKVYMLFEVEPSVELTGGPWYTDSDFDTAFVEALTDQVYKYILHKSYPAKKDSIFPSNHKIFQVDLSASDIQEILDSLIFEGKVYKKVRYVSSGGASSEDMMDIDSDDVESCSAFVYIATRGTSYGSNERFGLVHVPCGKCPVASFCSEDGPVNPKNCEYYQEWLASW